MSDLVKFIGARLDEKERRALAAREHWDDEGELMEWNDLSDESFAHARSHDPERDLREVAAERAILKAHDVPEHYCPLPVLPGRHGQLWTPAEGPCWTLYLLAAPDSDQPGYDPEWSPGF